MKRIFALFAIAIVLLSIVAVADRGYSSNAPGQTKPPIATPAPGSSETSPGHTKPPIGTPEPGNSERSPGLTKP